MEEKCLRLDRLFRDLKHYVCLNICLSEPLAPIMKFPTRDR